jgi:hypothetical protein
MASSQDSHGGRVIELFIPFTHAGKKYEVIKLKAVMLDHTLRWQQGAFRTSLALLAALSGENETTLRMLRYPDVDRVLGAMMDMLPEAIRNDIAQGVIPQAQPGVISPNGSRAAGGETSSPSLGGETGSVSMTAPAPERSDDNSVTSEDDPFTGIAEK